MPRVPNYLDYEEFPPEEDNYGWNDLPGSSYEVPIWMERMGLIDIPDWMRNEDGTCNVDYRIGMGTDKPKIYVTSLAAKDDEGDHVLPKPPVCRYFAKNRRCKYGKECYFSHETPGSQKPDVPRSRWISEKEVRKDAINEKSFDQIAREAREKREDEEGRPVKICQFYNDLDGCRRGLNCPNRHIEED